MLFSSPEFITWFLPAAVIGFFLLSRSQVRQLAIAWLILASLFFYGWWRPDYVPLLLLSIVVNYGLGVRLAETKSRPLLILGIAANLLLLGYFKYTSFAVENVNVVFGTGFSVPQYLLPLGISFWTFQQIAFLVDAFGGVTREKRFLSYCLFVSFFPQLIAGPIVHHKEMLPQFDQPDAFKPKLDRITMGLTVFAIGLFKKVVIADNIGVYADRAFGAAADGKVLTIAEAWSGALMFTFQLYYDFSGYADMAIGLGLLFGVSLPINFDSPLKAASIIEFWQRFHMTLTRFLTAYVYNPVVLNLTRRRVAAGKGILRPNAPEIQPFLALVAVPTLFTMFLSGIWHGAGWQFITFGLLHGTYLVINHAWRFLRHVVGYKTSTMPSLTRPLGILVTFTGVVVANVFFRSESAGQAWSMLQSMAGLNGVEVPQAFHALLGWVNQLSPGAVTFRTSPILLLNQIYWVPLLIVVTWLLPNARQWVGGVGLEHIRSADRPERGPGTGLLVWRPSVANGIFVGVLLYFAATQVLSKPPNQFIYFDF
ncbi:MAG: MBOAT family O-acyltransferase [Alphaproteobacteria bacterium]|nr:MBOAT family O-acyltransferase [Alphaproteobacteria bacterium]